MKIKLNNILSESGESLLHNTGYYTLNNTPVGEKAIASMPMDHSAHKMESMAASKVALAPSAKRQNEMPENWNGTEDQVVSIGTKPGMCTGFAVRYGRVEIGHNAVTFRSIRTECAPTTPRTG